MSKKKMSRTDHLLRAFRYKDALDDVLRVRCRRRRRRRRFVIIAVMCKLVGSMVVVPP
jgi:hypothetical protein